MCEVVSLKDTRPELVRSGSSDANEGAVPSDRKQEGSRLDDLANISRRAPTPGLHASDTPLKCTAKHAVPTHFIKRTKNTTRR